MGGSTVEHIKRCIMGSLKMYKRSNRRIWLLTMGAYALAMIPCATLAENLTATDFEKVPAAIPAAVSHLLQWPPSSVIEGKILRSDAPEVAFPKKQCSEWLHRVIDPSWLPDNEPEALFIKNEFDDCDVVHIHWLKNGYRIEVSQTASIFAMKLTPQGHDLGKDGTERLRLAKELCLQVFAKQGRRWADQGKVIAVSNLAQKIASYSFREDTIQNPQGDNGVLFGRPRTMKEEGVAKAQSETQAQAESSAGNPSWDVTEHAWRYWFRMVRWWNDGVSMGVFFPKVEGTDARADAGIGVPDYDGRVDKNWFRLPKDELNKIVPKQ